MYTQLVAGLIRINFTLHHTFRERGQNCVRRNLIAESRCESSGWPSCLEQLMNLRKVAKCGGGREGKRETDRQRRAAVQRERTFCSNTRGRSFLSLLLFGSAVCCLPPYVLLFTTRYLRSDDAAISISRMRHALRAASFYSTYFFCIRLRELFFLNCYIHTNQFICKSLLSSFYTFILVKFVRTTTTYLNNSIIVMCFRTIFHV